MSRSVRFRARTLKPHSVEINSSLVTSKSSLTVRHQLKTSIGIRNAVVAGLLLAGLTACDEPKVTTYQVPKEPRAEIAAPSHADHAREAPSRMARPKIAWTLPAGWREISPGQVNLAAFSIQAEGGQEAQVTVAALPLMAGREADIVNLWRGQLGLSQLEADQAREQLRELPINDEQGKLFELTGADPAKPDKIITVMIHRPGASWFYKLQGDATPVEAQRVAFIDFIKSVRLDESGSTPASTAPTPAGFAKAAPEGWTPLPAGRMQLAKFAVPTVQGATGQVSVSVFDNDTGGTLQNVNRWRGQIGLPDFTDSELSKVTQLLDPKLSGAILVNLTNESLQVVGAIVPRGSQWFFYKLIGNSPAVAAQKEAFVRFATSEL